VAVELGLAAARAVTLSSAGARSAPTPEGTRFALRASQGQLVDTAADWQRLRLALDVCWQADGVEVQRERFRCLDARAPHAGLPADPALWQPFSLLEHERLLADRRRAAVVFTGELPDDVAVVL
jgi:hypothetical protein